MDSSLDRRHFLGSAFAAGTLPLAGTPFPRAAGAGPAALAPQGVVRFVNLNKILKGWDSAKKSHADLESQLKARAEALMQRASDLDKKQKETKQFPVPNEASRRLERDVAIGVQELEYDRTELKRDQREMQLRLLLSEYQQIQATAEKWATQNGVQIVLAVIDEDPGEQDLATRYQRAVERPVLWNAPELDVTEEILKLLQVK